MSKRLGKRETIRLLKSGHHLVFMKGLYAQFYISKTLDTVPTKIAFSLIDDGLVKLSREGQWSSEYIYNDR